MTQFFSGVKLQKLRLETLRLQNLKFQKTIALLMVVFAFAAGSYSRAQLAGDGAGYADTPQLLSQNELENLVAPLALYPDALLSQVLVASTYPREVDEAQGWLQQNPYLQGRALMAAAQEQSWDPSVQALVAFPDVLARMNRDLSWTTELGNAFLEQQADVMEAVQNLRAEARGNGRLTSGPRLAVYTETEGDQSAIDIEPVDPQRMAVPNYDPNAVWGAPAEGEYPALGYSEGSGFGDVFGTIANLAGFLPGFTGLLGPRSWGWALGWLAQTLFVNNSFFSDFGFHNGFHNDDGGFRGSSVWVHNEHHRLGVPYGNRSLAGWHGSGRGRGRGEDRWGEGWNRFGGEGRGFSDAEGRRSRLGSSDGRSFSPSGRDNWRRFNEPQGRKSNFKAGLEGRSGRPASPTTERASAGEFGRRLSPGTRTDRWQSNRGGGRDSFANSGSRRGEPSRTITARRGWGESSRVSAARMSSGRESAFKHESGSQHRGWFGHGSSSSLSGKHGLSSHASRRKAPKAPHFAKSHGGGHSSGGHSGKRSHRG